MLSLANRASKNRLPQVQKDLGHPSECSAMSSRCGSIVLAAKRKLKHSQIKCIHVQVGVAMKRFAARRG